MTGLAPLQSFWLTPVSTIWIWRPFQLPLALPAGTTPPLPTAPVPRMVKSAGEQLGPAPPVTLVTLAVSVLSVTAEVFGLSKLPARFLAGPFGNRPDTAVVWWIVSADVVAAVAPPVPAPLSVQ